MDTAQHCKNKIRLQNIRKKYVEIKLKEKQEKKLKEMQQECAIKITKDAINSGDKSRMAFQNCYHRWPNFIGTYEEFKIRIESMFDEKMCWDNYPTWEVDHIIPLSKGGNHGVENIHPLLKHDNRTKSNKL